MPWSVTHNPELGIIEEVFSGPVTAADLREAVSQRIALEKATGARKVLNDVSEIELQANIVDVFEFPAKQYDEEGSDRSVCMALVMPRCSQTRTIANFFITASANRGWTVVPFEDRQSALDWLTGQASPAQKPAGCS